MSGILDFLQSLMPSQQGLANALPNSIFANMQNAQIRKGMMDAALQDLQGQAGLRQQQLKESQQTELDKQRAQAYLAGSPNPDLSVPHPAAGAPGMDVRDFYRTLGAAKNQPMTGGINDLPQATRPFIQALAATDPQKAAELGFGLAMPKTVTFGKPGETPVDPATGAPVGPAIPEPATPNQAFNPDGTPNIAYQNFQKQLRQPALMPSDVFAQQQALRVPQPSPGYTQEAFAQQKALVQERADATLKQQIGDAADIDQMATSIAKYQMAPLSGFAMAKPAGQAIMSRVTQINPQYNAQNYSKSQAAYRDFGSGKLGTQTRSANVAIAHLGTMGELIDALGNGDVQLLNQARNSFKQQFGSDAPTNFNAARSIVGDEIIKFIVGTGGALADRENAQNQINAANSPGQLKGIIQTYKNLMAGQLAGLKQQYQTSTMRDDFDTLLSPETKSILSTMQPAGGGVATPGAVPTNQQINDLLNKYGPKR